jgi:hypothetical protein
VEIIFVLITRFANAGFLVRPVHGRPENVSAKVALLVNPLMTE